MFCCGECGVPICAVGEREYWAGLWRMQLISINSWRAQCVHDIRLSLPLFSPLLFCVT